MREEPQQKRLQLHQPSQFVTQEDAVAHLKATEEALSDEKSRIVDNAYSYLKTVKETFKNDQEKYIGFLQVMKDFRLYGFITNEMMNRLKDVFEGHNSLLLGINVFLPRGYEITDTSIDRPPRNICFDFDQALIYIQKIKRRFQNDDKNVYKSFQQMLKMSREGDISLDDLHQQVKLLFCDHKDLLEDFTKYLPKPMDSAHVTHLQDSEQPSSGHISGLKSVRYSYKENMAKRQKTADTNSNHHQIFQSLLREGVERTSVGIDNGNLKKVNKEKHLNEDSMWKLKDGGKKRPAHNRETELDGMYHCPDTGTIISTSGVLMPEKRLTEQVYGSPGDNSLQDPPMDCSKTLMNIGRQKRDFCKKVKRNIVDRELEDNMRNTEQDDNKDRHRDHDQSCRSRDKLNNNASPISSKDEDTSPQAGDCCKREKRKLSKTESEKENKRNKEQHHGKNRHGDNDQSCRSIDKLNNNASPTSSKGKGMDKPISEFCPSDFELCTPSYCLLPENCLKPVASYSTDLAAEVLNDCCVTMTSGSEDNSFKHTRKNLYEEILFRCEDDRYELDMLMESISATIINIKELLEKKRNSTINGDDHIQIEEHLTVLNLRCIEQIYGDHGLELLDLLHGNPSRALPVIQKRLQQKKDELSNCKAEFNKVWAGVFAKNYHKSLDHRSFYFKQRDKKSLSTKALLQDIKDISERKSKENGIPIAVAVGNSTSPIPHLKYKFPDHALYEDLHELIKHSLDEVCTNKEESDKTMRIWTIFFDFLFGLRSNVAGGRKDLAEFNNYNSNRMDASKVKCFELTSGGHLKKNVMKLKNRGLTFMGNLKEYSTTEAETSNIHDVEAEQPTVQDYQIHMVDQSLQNGGGPFGSSEMQYSQTLIPNIDDVANTVKPGSCLNILNSERINLSCIAGTSLKFSSSIKGLDDCGVLSTEKDLEVAEVSDWKPLELERENCVSDYKPDILNPKCNGDELGYGGLKVKKEEDKLFLSVVIGDHKEEDDVGCRDDEQKAEGESKFEKITDQHAEDLFGSPDCFMVITTSLTAPIDCTILSNISGKNSVFYGNDSFYVLCRLYQTLYERIHLAKKNLLSLQKEMKNLNDIPPSKVYSKFMDSLYSFLDGSSGNVEFENNCQEIIGTKSYMLYTLDNLILKLVKQLRNVASGKMEKDLLELGLCQRLRSTSNISDEVYCVNASRVLNSEKIYRFEFASHFSELSIQLMDIDAKVLEPTFSDYLHTDLLSIGMKRRGQVFLSRNTCKYTSLGEHYCISKRMKGVTVMNGLDQVISCQSKASYVRVNVELL
ncbi:hypothetical protein SUGI_1014110 [Cryptomeria japonica]|nr:hypothetical protein SUGI_1014110 [Cryptomeria japonica]